MTSTPLYDTMAPMRISRVCWWNHSSTINTRSRIYCSSSHRETSPMVSIYRSILTELNFPLTTPSTNFSDNQSAISIAHHPEFHARTKHIDIAVHFLRDHMKKGTLDLYYINTEYNLADIFTKTLKKPSHINFTYELGVLYMVENSKWNTNLKL